MFGIHDVALHVLYGVAAVLTAWFVVWRSIKATYHFIKKVALGIETLHDVAAEFRPNGGSSLKDQVTDIRAEIKSVKKTLTAHITSHP